MTYRFESFTLDSATRRLLRAGQEIHLSPKAFDLLLSLVDNRARAMSKADLLEHLWPSTFVNETSLAGLITEVRRALGDAADDPQFVRTMHRFGYRFIGSVHERDAGEEPVKSAARYWLIWETRQVPLTDGDNILGRAPDAAVWIDALGVSRHHARIIVDGRHATIEDLGSKNGTYVGADRVTSPCLLADGDRIRLGSVVIIFRIPPAVSSTDTVGSLNSEL